MQSTHQCIPSGIRAPTTTCMQRFRRTHRRLSFPLMFSSGNSSAGANINATDMLLPTLKSQEGGKVHGISLVGRELRTTQDLEEGSAVVTVPLEFQLRYDLIEDPKLIKLFEKLPAASGGSGSPAWQVKQALAVLWHLSRGESSQLHIPLHALPGLAPGVPVPCVGMYFQDELLPELQDEALIRSALNHRYWWKEVWANELQNLAGTDEDPFCGMQITSDMFGWAIAVSLSRCFGLKSANSHVMTPVIDMGDHACGSNCAIRSNEDASISMHTTKRVNKGSPLSLTYGPHCNALQLLSYGFVSGDNPHNIFSLMFDVGLFSEIINQFGGEVGVPLNPWQMQALEQLGIKQAPIAHRDSQSAQCDQALDASSNESRLVSQESVFLKAQGMPPVDPRLLAGLRVMLLAEDERFLIQLTSPDSWGRWGAPFSKDNEVKVLKALSSIITAFYKGFPTTIQEDKRLLDGLQELLSKQAPSPPSQFQPPSSIEAYKLALQYRLAMKQSLEKSLVTVIARLKEVGK